VKIIAESLLSQICKILSSVLYNRVVRFSFTEITVVDHRHIGFTLLCSMPCLYYKVTVVVTVDNSRVTASVFN